MSANYFIWLQKKSTVARGFALACFALASIAKLVLQEVVYSLHETLLNLNLLKCQYIKIPRQ